MELDLGGLIGRAINRQTIGEALMRHDRAARRPPWRRGADDWRALACGAVGDACHPLLWAHAVLGDVRALGERIRSLGCTRGDLPEWQLTTWGAVLGVDPRPCATCGARMFERCDAGMH